MAYLTTTETRQMAMNVARLCGERGWSQLDLARVSGLSVSTIRKMRRAQHSAQEGTLQALAVAFGVPDSNDLITPWEPPPPGSDSSPEPERPAQRPTQAAFNQQVEELRRVAARAARDDPQAADRLYIQLTGRVRQMTQAVRVQARKRN